MQDKPENLYTLDEVAEALRTTRRTLYRHINAGTLKTVTVGARRYVRDSDYREFAHLDDRKDAGNAWSDMSTDDLKAALEAIEKELKTRE